jgi:hypothetical protein
MNTGSDRSVVERLPEPPFEVESITPSDHRPEDAG